jgi:hypothetical protein
MQGMRYLEPRRFQHLCAAGVLGLSKTDGFLVERRASTAVQAYYDEIVADPLLDRRIGLALSIHHLLPMPLRQVFAIKLPLIFDMHDCLSGQGVRSEPIDLAAWFA